MRPFFSGVNFGQHPKPKELRSKACSAGYAVVPQQDRPKRRGPRYGLSDGAFALQVKLFRHSARWMRGGCSCEENGDLMPMLNIVAADHFTLGSGGLGRYPRRIGSEDEESGYGYRPAAIT